MVRFCRTKRLTISADFQIVPLQCLLLRQVDLHLQLVLPARDGGQRRDDDFDTCREQRDGSGGGLHLRRHGQRHSVVAGGEGGGRIKHFPKEVRG